LNRFEKHYLNLGSILEDEEFEYVKIVEDWLDEIFKILLKKTVLKR
jgi:hypothetical protein